ncbi:tyrosine-type recombinase/integrase [Fredinandcohnia humi]
MHEQFFQELRRTGKSELTIKQYKSSLNRFEKWFNEQENYPLHTPDGYSHTLAQATEIDIGNFKRFAVNNYNTSTVRITLSHLRAYFDFLVSQNAIPDNPVKHIDNVTVARNTPKWLNRNEQNALIRAVRRFGDIRELAIITTLLHTGLRVQELCDLKLTDIEIGERRGKLVVRRGKHNRRREVPLNNDVRRVLTSYLEERKDFGEYLFNSQRSEQMTTRAVQHMIQKYSKLTEIPTLTCHSLRHTFCHELVQRRVPLDVVARLAGHIKNDGTPNIEQTLVYTQPGEEDLIRAVEELSWA